MIYLISADSTTWLLSVFVAGDGTPALNATPQAGVPITLQLSDGVSLAWQVGVNDDGTFFNAPVGYAAQPIGVRLRDQYDQGWNVYIRGLDFSFEMKEIDFLSVTQARVIPMLAVQSAEVLN